MNLVEQVARAQCLTGNFDPDEIMPNHGPRWRYYEVTAQAAIDTVLAALERPSEDAIWAAIAAIDEKKAAMRLREESTNPEDLPDYDEGDEIQASWNAMLTAFKKEQGL